MSTYQHSHEPCRAEELSGGQRLDVWLFRTRLIKSRSLATKMILKGKVRITRCGRTERVTKPGLKIKPGDTAVFMRGEHLIHVEMVAEASRRGPAPEARALYKLIPVQVSGTGPVAGSAGFMG